MATKVIMPQLGESVVEGTVVEWLIQEGQSVEEFGPLLEINTDKVASEIPSPASGTLIKILVPEGATVKVGTVLAWIGEIGEPLIDDTQPLVLGQSAKPDISGLELNPTSSTGSERELGFISPAVARLAKEHQIDLSQVHGSGDGGRITKKDVLDYIESEARAQTADSEKPVAETDAALRALTLPSLTACSAIPGGEERKETEQTQPVVVSADSPSDGDTLLPLSIQRKVIAERMQASLRTAPHVTTVMEADLSRVEAHRQVNQPVFAKDGADLSYTVYFVAAVSTALKMHPLINSSWSEAGILIHKEINIGLAVSLGEDGLIVPVIKGADRLTLLGIAKAVEELAEKGRAQKLRPEQVQDGTFTISNLGAGGALFATPIINQPQAAILGIGAIQRRPLVVEQDAIAIRPMVYLSLSFDHRILDGTSADGFLAKVVGQLENWGL